MKKLSYLLAVGLIATFSQAQAQQVKPIPLDYNPANQETAATKSIPNVDADLVEGSYKDLDQDGVADKLDHCPNTILHVDVDAKGCELDSDQDGVFNRLDQCPDTAAGVKVNRFGCEGDEDNDGVYDSKDQCPGTPEGTIVDEVGCKAIGDSDKDGVNDADDLCPDTPAGVMVNSHGCEPKAIALSNIVFDSYEHAIRNDQVDILKRDAGVLSELKEGQVVLITGHTDWQAPAPVNERLSWRRANSTKAFLNQHLNFDSDRIYINGKGEMEPVATNKTAEGRQKNRRIEMKIIMQDQLPDDALTTIPKEMLVK
ncbi:MAG: OmpA family protein [Thiomicrorhabdus sp.]|nr:OmpA family protein [Thiomicrorhabdus sp.]